MTKLELIERVNEVINTPISVLMETQRKSSIIWKVDWTDKVRKRIENDKTDPAYNDTYDVLRGFITTFATKINEKKKDYQKKLNEWVKNLGNLLKTSGNPA